jgi:D-beta-D-heptose 7-phosphate kinase/D-beta-D-heptose 1-phosphate adenosyltransferase
MKAENHELKIIPREEAISISASEKKCGSVVGFTSGAFDILHSQHIHFLQGAKGECDILIVGLNSDSSIKEHKGADRPVLPQEERLSIVAAIQYVDYVFLFDELDNSINLPLLNPTLFLKGGDYYYHKVNKQVKLIEEPIIQKHNLETNIILIPTDINISTTKFIERMRETLKII